MPASSSLLGEDGAPRSAIPARRVIPQALRRALDLRDRTCTHPGCGSPPLGAMPITSSTGPPRETNLSNLRLPCRRHHRRSTTTPPRHSGNRPQATEHLRRQLGRGPLGRRCTTAATRVARVWAAWPTAPSRGAASAGRRHLGEARRRLRARGQGRRQVLGHLERSTLSRISQDPSALAASTWPDRPSPSGPLQQPRHRPC